MMKLEYFMPVAYDEALPTEGGESGEDYQRLIESIEQLDQTVSELNQNLTTEEESEEVTEEVTEEVSEEILEEDLPVQKKDIAELKESIDGLAVGLNEIKRVEESQIEYTQNRDTEPSVLTFLDESVDHHLYLTSEVENATINDVFTLSLSIRNLLLVFFLFWFCLKILGMLRAVVDRVANR